MGGESCRRFTPPVCQIPLGSVTPPVLAVGGRRLELFQWLGVGPAASAVLDWEPRTKWLTLCTNCNVWFAPKIEKNRPNRACAGVACSKMKRIPRNDTCLFSTFPLTTCLRRQQFGWLPANQKEESAIGTPIFVTAKYSNGISWKEHAPCLREAPAVRRSLHYGIRQSFGRSSTRAQRAVSVEGRIPGMGRGS